MEKERTVQFMARFHSLLVVVVVLFVVVVVSCTRIRARPHTRTRNVTYKLLRIYELRSTVSSPLHCSLTANKSKSLLNHHRRKGTPSANASTPMTSPSIQRRYTCT